MIVSIQRSTALLDVECSSKMCTVIFSWMPPLEESNIDNSWWRYMGHQRVHVTKEYWTYMSCIRPCYNYILRSRLGVPILLNYFSFSVSSMSSSSSFMERNVRTGGIFNGIGSFKCLFELSLHYLNVAACLMYAFIIANSQWSCIYTAWSSCTGTMQHPQCWWDYDLTIHIIIVELTLKY